MTFSPFLRIVMLSEISNTSSSLWDTKRIVTPFFFKSVIISKSRVTSFLVRAVVGSSMIISFALSSSALEIAISCLSATGSVSTSASRSTSKLIFWTASSAILRNSFLLTSFFLFASTWLNARFSITVRFGKIEKSW